MGGKGAWSGAFGRQNYDIQRFISSKRVGGAALKIISRSMSAAENTLLKWSGEFVILCCGNSESKSSTIPTLRKPGQ